MIHFFVIPTMVIFNEGGIKYIVFYYMTTHSSHIIKDDVFNSFVKDHHSRNYKKMDHGPS